MLLMFEVFQTSQPPTTLVACGAVTGRNALSAEVDQTVVVTFFIISANSYFINKSSFD